MPVRGEGGAGEGGQGLLQATVGEITREVFLVARSALKNEKSKRTQQGLNLRGRNQLISSQSP